LTGNAATLFVDPREYWNGLDRRSRLLAGSVAASILLHAMLLAVQFRFPETLRFKAAQAPLDVILVNARSREKPARAEALAQANLDGGGSVEENRRARTPLPVTHPRTPGRDLAEAKKRVQELEARQQELLARAQGPAPVAAPETPREAQAAEAPQVSGRDLADLALAAMRLQAQIDKRIQEYQKRPRKRFLGANATEYRFALYEEEWRAKIERIGTLHYPAEARGRLYGNLRLTVTIRPDGSVESVELDRSSGLKILDEAAFQIVRLAAPFAAFPPDIRKDTDLLVITRTWFFGQGDRIWTESR
jgi:protein TonB